MTMGRWLLTPWIAAHRSMRWLMGTVMALSVLGAASCSISNRNLIGPFLAVYLLYPAVVLMWVYFIPNMLNLALFGKRLRVPGVGRQIVASVAIYAVLSTLAPALLLACFGAHASIPTMVSLLALVAAASLLYALLPWYLAIPVCFVPTFLDALPHTHHAHAFAVAGFGRFAAVTVIGLWVVNALRWWQLMRRADTPVHFLRRPIIFGMSRNLENSARRGADAGIRPSDLSDSTYLLRQRPDWMQPEIDLRHTGPRYPQRALRVALGGRYLPQTWKGRLYQAVPVVGMLLILAVLFLVVEGPQTPDQLHTLWRHGGAIFGQWIAALVCVVFVAGVCMQIDHLWTGTRSALPLLALLPGLDDGARGKRKLLRTILTLPLITVLAITAVMLVLAMDLDLSAAATTLALLIPLGCAAFTVACVLRSVGGWQPRGLQALASPLLLAILFVLASAGTLLPGMAFGAMSAHTRVDVICGLLALWLVFACGVAYIGQRGWRGLRRRAHPFLAC